MSNKRTGEAAGAAVSREAEPTGAKTAWAATAASARGIVVGIVRAGPIAGAPQSN